MTSWPWMEGIDVAIADPVDPINEQDTRLSVKEIIQKHKKKIDDVKAELAEDPLYDPNKHDDLWIVRFLLSHKNKTKAAVKAAVYTLKFRKDHKIDEMGDIRMQEMGPNSPSEAQRVYFANCDKDALLFTLPDKKRGVVSFIRLAGLTADKLLKNCPKENWLPGYAYSTEWTHQWLDYVTRTSGRLTKSIRFLDLSDFKMSMFSREMYLRDGEAMGVMEDCYPQLLQAMFVCDSPTWMQVPWRILRPLMPKRVTSKFEMISPKTKANERKLLYEYIDEEHLPTRFGGKNAEWPVHFPIN